jgi:hypothetical protein
MKLETLAPFEDAKNVESGTRRKNAPSTRKVRNICTFFRLCLGRRRARLTVKCENENPKRAGLEMNEIAFIVCDRREIERNVV